MEPGQTPVTEGNTAPVTGPVAPAAEPAASAPAPEPQQPEPQQTPPAEPQRSEDDQEWDEVQNELFPGLSGNNEPKEQSQDEPTEPEKESEAAAASETPPEAAQPPAEQAESDETTPEEVPESQATARDARIAQREAQVELEQVAADVRERLYKDVPTELLDKDGNPIRTIEDVMQYIDPRTGEAFTEEAAGLWLLNSQQQLRQNLETINQRVQQIAEVNVALKDEADVINAKYGKLLTENTQLRDRLWSEFEKTLKKDPETGIITSMPVSLRQFYELVLEPYAAQAATAQAATAQAASAPATSEPPQPSPQQRAQAHSERSDIFGGNTKPNLDPDEQEWNEVANEYFGSQLK